ILPLPVRENRLRQVENLLFAAELPPSGIPQPCSGRRGEAPAVECRSPRRKRPRLERPSRLEVDSLRAEVEQLKGLLKAPEPTPAFQAAAPWESGDDFLCRAYDIAARMARIGNSLSVLLLAQSQMLQPGMAGASLGDTNDAALQAFGHMSRELGRLLSTLVVTRRQVWLAQAPISDDCRQSLRRLPVIPGQLFGPEAKRALERRRQSSQAPEAWGGRSGAMGPPAPQPRRCDVREPR
ncbi:hypothetical protein XENOCAPTIV_004409, partial [Xenoophorus captivus]